MLLSIRVLPLPSITAAGDARRGCPAVFRRVKRLRAYRRPEFGPGRDLVLLGPKFPYATVEI